MNATLRLPRGFEDRLRCPVCRARLEQHGDRFACTLATCGGSFPILNGVPILLNDAASLFSTRDFLQQANPFFRPTSRFRRLFFRLVPEISHNDAGAANFRALLALLLEQTPHPSVLVVGGGSLGAGSDRLLAHADIERLESDVFISPRTNLVCDAHDLPFADGAFDAVVVQAVLEHVVDPYRCADEIHRVLKPAGLVYAETPFMQQVHGGRYDFTRFTELGHRRLFRRFEAVRGGVVCGPGMALAWAYTYFMVSMASGRVPRLLLYVLARWTSFWLKYLDPWLNRKPGAVDAASAFYFLGRKSARTLPDRELIGLYRGLS